MSDLPAKLWQIPPVTRFLAPNRGPYTLEGTNTYIVGVTRALIIDPGPNDPRHLSSITGWVQNQRAHVQAILLTHPHPDHADGAASLAAALDVPVLAPSEVLHGRDVHVDASDVWIIPSPGHTLDDVSVYLPKEHILFSGDTVLGRGTTVITWPEGDMAAYLNTLRRFLDLAPRVIFPGHGAPVEDAATVLSEYIAHRLEREKQILARLTDPVSTDQLTTVIYPDLDSALLPLARQTVLAHLHKLVREGRVRESEGIFINVMSP